MTRDRSLDEFAQVESSASETDDDPAVPETDDDPAVPETDDDPAVSETDDDPTVPETDDDPAVSETDDDPTVPETDDDSDGDARKTTDRERGSDRVVEGATDPESDAAAVTPAVATSIWSSDGHPCDQCGSVVRRQWCLVDERRCTDCMEW